MKFNIRFQTVQKCVGANDIILFLFSKMDSFFKYESSISAKSTCRLLPTHSHLMLSFNLWIVAWNFNLFNMNIESHAFYFLLFLPYLNKKKHRISLEFFILCLAWGENSWENNFSIIIKKNMWNNNFFLKLYSIEIFFVRRTMRKGF